MDPSNAFEFFALRRDLLSGFLLEYSMLLDENPELTTLLSFEAYVQFSFSFYRAGERHQDHERMQQEIKRLREHLPLPDFSPMPYK